ncbi:TlpA family protein disulfide reductase [bacterium]|nr:MAG: TlpA family protein disulfide reductase [bacterium]
MRGFLEKRMKKITMMYLIIPVFLTITFAVAVHVQAERFSPWKVEQLIGKKAPAFSVKDLSDKRVSFSSYKGKPILLNFWATWCPYCREERAFLNTLHSEFKDRGLRIISVSTDRSADKVKSYAKKISMDFVVLHDTDREAASRYGVYSLPVTFLIDKNGIIQHKILGLRDWTDSKSRKLIENILRD